MSCKICGRGACTESFHSAEEQWELEENSQFDKMTKCAMEANLIAEKTIAERDKLRAHRDDLLAALKGCVGYLAGLPRAYRPDDAWFKPASAAISKAEETE